MSLHQTLRFIWNHPLAARRRTASLVDFLKWQVGSRLLAGSFAMPFVNDTRLLIRRGMTGATGSLYVGLHEFEDMAFMLHLLRPEDLFVDVGANVGSYVVLAGAVGARCVAFEPVPASFKGLLDNIRLNGLETRVRAEMYCIGRKAGRTAMTTCYDSMNHVLTAREVSGGDRTGTDIVDVEVQTLDGALNGESPIALKIDVEGFETEVLAGAATCLGAESLAAVLLELNGSGARYGFDESAVHGHMIDAGFRAYRYEPFKRQLTELAGPNRAGNTLYVRGVQRVSERVRNAREFLAKGIAI